MLKWSHLLISEGFVPGRTRTIRSATKMNIPIRVFSSPQIVRLKFQLKIWDLRSCAPYLFWRIGSRIRTLSCPSTCEQWGKSQVAHLWLWSVRLHWCKITPKFVAIVTNFFSEKRRRSWIVPACLSTQPSTMTVPFRAWGSIGSIVDSKALPEDNLEKQVWNRFWTFCDVSFKVMAP